MAVAHVPLVVCVSVLVCGAYLGMLQHAIYKCAPQRCNIKYFSLVAVLAIVVVVVVAIVTRCCCCCVAVVFAIAGGVADYVVGFGGCVNL